MVSRLHVVRRSSQRDKDISQRDKGISQRDKDISRRDKQTEYEFQNICSAGFPAEFLS